MTLVRLKYISLGLGVLLIMSFLYVKTQAVDLDKHKQLLDHSSQFKRVDAILNQHILEIRQGLLPFYDPIVGNMTELGQLQAEMVAMLRHLRPEDPAVISQRVEALSQVLAQKEELLEGFKTSKAVLRNSLRYLPLATTQIAALLPPGGQGDALRQSLNTLLRDTLIYNLTSDAELGAALGASARALRQDSALRFPKLRDDLHILLSHVGIVLKHKTQTDTQVQQLLTLPTAQRMDELLQVYITEHDRMMQNVNAYRLALYGFSVLLLGTIGYILLRLNQTAATLRRTVTDLHYQKFAMDQHAIVSITDRYGAITYANQKFCDISQYTTAELIGQNHRLSKSGYHPPSFYKTLWDTITQGKVWHGQLLNQAKDGSRYWADTTIVPFVDDNGAPYQYVAIRTDITEIKQAEEALRESEQRYRSLIEDMHDLVQSVDTEGRFVFVNHAWRETLGYAPEEVAGLTIWDIIHPDSMAHCQQVFSKIMSGESINHLEALFISKTGASIDVEGSITARYIGDKMIATQAIFKDITARKQAEADHIIMEEALRRSQKMEAIGQLSGGIAHDFNNQLGVIIGYLDFLQDYTVNDEKPRRWVDTAAKATLRCMDLTRQLLAFSRRQSKEKTVVNINGVLKDLDTMITRSVTPEVEVQYYLTDELWLTEIDAGEFQDAILNLVLNARDAMPGGGRLLLETSNKQLDASYAGLNPGVEAGDYVQLMLSDTGTGMNKETVEHVFEPFFTTKPEGKGTGLGMAMVYGFTKRYGGHIKIYSELGVGTTIRLYLPRSTASESAVTADTHRAAELPRGNESILIVDDETDLLQLADQYLSDLGYRTQLAETAAQALDILAGDAAIDLLFSDVVMPGGMNGYELAQQATKLKPGLKVLMTSGFTAKTIAGNDLARFSAHLLNKPYRKADLAQRIRRVLDDG